ncbi:DinB family protein [Bacillus sp. CGMCC 1.16607]|uniref:DinB family protein n=1 Tax=Bacillus sp. CGMCC 1.16607 TaxID=3351842 RepID=UPI00363174CF
MSTKQNVLNEMARILDKIKALELTDSKVWQKPIAEGKFSKAAILSHLMYWDYFLIQVAIPDIYRKNEIVFPDHDDKNELASIYAKLISKEQLLGEFKEVREKLIMFVRYLPTKVLEKEIKVNDATHCPRTKQPYTLEYILEEFVQHDDHHVKQLVG